MIPDGYMTVSTPSGKKAHLIKGSLAKGSWKGKTKPLCGHSVSRGNVNPFLVPASEGMEICSRCLAIASKTK